MFLYLFLIGFTITFLKVLLSNKKSLSEVLTFLFIMIYCILLSIATLQITYFPYGMDKHINEHITSFYVDLSHRRCVIREITNKYNISPEIHENIICNMYIYDYELEQNIPNITIEEINHILILNESCLLNFDAIYKMCKRYDIATNNYYGIFFFRENIIGYKSIINIAQEYHINF